MSPIRLHFHLCFASVDRSFRRTGALLRLRPRLRRARRTSQKRWGFKAQNLGTSEAVTIPRHYYDTPLLFSPQKKGRTSCGGMVSKVGIQPLDSPDPQSCNALLEMKKLLTLSLEAFVVCSGDPPHFLPTTAENGILVSGQLSF